jgi:hypothetical protein
MRQFKLAMSILVVAMAAAGCGRKNDADRTATKVLRPEDVKVTLGPETSSKPAPPAAEAPAEKPAEKPAAESKAP